MAYQAPETAEHHLKMAKAYLDEAKATLAAAKDASQYISQVQLKDLAEAAQHLNKARAIDPNATLVVEDKEDGARITYKQDFLAGLLLLHEGVAHLNITNAISGTYDGTQAGVPRKSRKEGIRSLEKARDSLEKSLIYNPYHEDALKFLYMTYQRLGDRTKARQILERRIELKPEDMSLHREIRTFDQTRTLSPMFQSPGISFSVVMRCVLAFGVVLLILALPVGSWSMAIWGIIIVFAAAGILRVSEWFG